MTRFWDGRTDEQTDGVTALLDLLSPSATQVKMNEYIESEELRTLVVCIKEKRARYSAKGHPSSRKIKVNLHVYQTHQVTCISIGYIQ